MSSILIEKAPLPEGALLKAYQSPDAFTDCYSVCVPFVVSQSKFIRTFYSTKLFRLERLLLGMLAGYPSTDSDAEALAEGLTDEFSAWRVEVRLKDQILLSDVRGRTRSWLMVKHSASCMETNLYFGSAVVLVENARTGTKSMGWIFSALGAFHKLYSVLLLRSAVKKLRCR